MFVYIGCAGGGTSSMLCQRVTKAITDYDENLNAVFDTVSNVFRKQLAYGAHYDLVFAYGGLDDIRSYNAFDYGQLFDVVFAAPQVSYLTPLKQQLLSKFPTIVKDLPPKLFGMMDAMKAYDLLLEELITLDMWRGYQSQVALMNKGSDKNMEIYVAGASHADRYFKEFFEYLKELDIRVLAQPYNLETLYSFEPETDFDIRFVFGSMTMLTENDFARVARRIDGFLISPSSVGAFINRRSWATDYQIPHMKFDDEKIKKQLKNGKFEEQKDKLLSFLEKVQLRTEFTTERSVSRFEEKELPKRKKFGFIEWELS